ncbi:MAG: DDE-type integrase/transposase/recombinase [Acetobacteraceae bacterium]
MAEAFVYLAVILDAYSRRVVGWALADHLRAELALSALEMVLSTREVVAGTLVHHSDRGVQYACSDYIVRLERAEIQPSPHFSVRPNGAVHQWRKDPPRKLSVGPGSRRAVCRGNPSGRSLVTKAAIGRSSNPAGRNAREA